MKKLVLSIVLALSLISCTPDDVSSNCQLVTGKNTSVITTGTIEDEYYVIGIGIGMDPSYEVTAEVYNTSDVGDMYKPGNLYFQIVSKLILNKKYYLYCDAGRLISGLFVIKINQNTYNQLQVGQKYRPNYYEFFIKEKAIIPGDIVKTTYYYLLLRTDKTPQGVSLDQYNKYKEGDTYCIITS